MRMSHFLALIKTNEAIKMSINDVSIKIGEESVLSNRQSVRISDHMTKPGNFPNDSEMFTFSDRHILIAGDTSWFNRDSTTKS